MLPFALAGRVPGDNAPVGIPTWAQAGLWGLVAGGALLLGAAIGYQARLPQRAVAMIMGFGGGVLISALSFELMDEAYKDGGTLAAGLGFLGGAMLFTGANRLIAWHGGKHRKRSSGQPTEGEDRGSGLALAAGALVDGIPESIAIGVSLIGGGKIALVTVFAVFLSNIPEGLASSAGMREAGRPASYVFAVWGSIALTSGLAAIVGYTVFAGLPKMATAAILAVAAGGILAMLADTMIPEAYEHAHDYIGLTAAAGFLSAFLLSKMV